MNGNSSSNTIVPHLKQRKRHWVDNDEYNEIKMQRSNLPIHKVKDDLIKKLAEHDVIILKGDTACGKTTQIPQFILTKGLSGDLAIAVTQPRRVAAISIAERVAKEMRTALGQKVGYCVRFDNTTSENTRIKYVTDGMLLRESIGDPLLSTYSWVILDEAHERTIHTDVLFGVVKSARKKRKEQGCPPLKIVIMSATIEEDKVSSYFNDAPIFSIPGREYEIYIHSADTLYDDIALFAVSTVWHLHINEPEGDILVFLTGEEEIEWAVAHTHRVLKANPTTELKLHPCALYAALPSHLQCAVLAPSAPKTRKVIYATNIAETSLTIPGIKYVVDSGVVKTKSFNPSCGLDWLKVQQISKAQAEQRMGRAGREGKGHCYRLYSKEQYEQFAEFPVPEIQRSNLASVILQIIGIGISEIRTFDFLDKPPDENIDAAIKQLILLGAVKEDDEGNIYLTDIGKKMVNFPLDPRFSKMIITSQQYKCTDEILSIISMLTVEFVFQNSPEMREKYEKFKDKFCTGEGDHIMLLNVYKTFRSTKQRKEWCTKHNVNHKCMAKAMAIRKQLHYICQSMGIMPCSCGQDTSLVRKCLASGLFMNSASLYKKKAYKTIGSKEKVFIHPTSSLFGRKSQCCIYTELVETSKCYMRNVSVVDGEWLMDAAPEYFKDCGFKPFKFLVV